MSIEALSEAEEFLLEMARTLHRGGASAPRLESILSALAKRLGVEASMFSTPTALFAAFGPPACQRVVLSRESPGAVHLERLRTTHRIARGLLDGELAVDEARRRLARVEETPPAPPVPLEVAAFSLISGSAAILFGGQLEEALAALVSGAAIGALGPLVGRATGTARLFVPLAAFVGAFVAGLAGRLVPEVDGPTVILASLIVLLPGFGLTLAFKELASGHLASGTARFMGAVVTLLLLGFGTALGRHLAAPDAAAAGTHLAATPGALFALALIVAPLALAVLFRAHRRDWPAILGIGVLAVLVARLAPATLGGEEVGALLAAFVVAAGANLHSRVFRLPSAILQVPGLMLLVPGSLGFRGILSLLDHDILAGVGAAFDTLKLAATIVTGVLLANVVVRTHASDRED